MRTLCLMMICLLVWPASLWSQKPLTKVWGGKADDQALTLITTDDGETVLAGFTFSEGAGRSDIWVRKLSAAGELLWEQEFGDEAFDWVHEIIETRDGNYVLAGYSRLEDKGLSQAWIFQLNRHGELMWSEHFGGDYQDEARAIIQTRDGGFAITGLTHSFAAGKSDVWLIRLNAVGQLQWQENFGGAHTEQGYTLAETADEGFVIGGYFSRGDSLKADMLLIRTDSKGAGQWRRILRNPGNDVLERVCISQEGSIYAAGWGYNGRTRSLDGKLFKFSAGGKIIWEQHFGDGGKDCFYDLLLDEGGSGTLALVGQTARTGHTAAVWLLETDLDGRLQWQHFTEGGGRQWGHSLSRRPGGGYHIAGGWEAVDRNSEILWLQTDAEGFFAEGPLETSVVLEKDLARADTFLTPEDRFKPRLFMLCVGISDFADKRVELEFAHTDAAAVAARFRTLRGSLYGDVQARVLQNNTATLREIKEGIAWLEKEATQRDVIMIFISSHGALDNKGNLYILPYDFDAYNLFASGLHIRDLTEGTNGVPCKKLFFLDACHSGQSGWDLIALGTPKALNVNHAVKELMRKEGGVTVMTSSSGKEFSYENPRWGHGAFTKALLEGLDGAADYDRDYLIHFKELDYFVSNRVKELTRGRQHPFTPVNLIGDLPMFVVD